MTELTAEVRSFRSVSEAAREALSRRTEEWLSCETGDIAALQALAESEQKESALSLTQL
jgi:hypothetical protein